MSKTQRDFPDWKRYYYRRPKTTNEIRQNTGLLADIVADDIPYDISGLNRIHRYIPNAWDDVAIAAFYERPEELKPYNLP
jgi:hypothetical protein